MDKQAYHYNKKKLKGKTAGTYRYFYSCDPYDNPDIWLEDKPYAEKINPMPRLKLQSANGRFYTLLTRKSITIITPTPESLLPLFTAKMKKNSHPNSDKRE